MKKITLLVAFMLAIVTGSYGQASSYSFSESTEVYTPVVGTSSTATGDDGIQNLVPIGFTFNFDNVAYTDFGISTNGWIKMGTVAIGGGSWTNALGNAATHRPLIAPFWDDHNRSTGSIQYSLSGTAPNQILEVGWDNISISNGGTASTTIFGSFKLRLYETTNVIEFVYGPTIASAGAITASVGLNGTASFLSVTPAATSTASSVTANNAINTAANVVGKKYIFTPPVPCAGTPTGGVVTPANLNLCTGNAVGNLVASGYTTGVTGVTFQWEESPDGTSWANAVGGTGATTATYTPPVYSGTPIQYRLNVTCTISGLSAASSASIIGSEATPSIQVSNAIGTNLQLVSATVNWTIGNGGRRVVILSDSPAITDPTDGNAAALVTNTVYAGSGQQMMYDGIATTVNVTGLTQNTSYYGKVYEYLRCGTDPYDYYYNVSSGTNVFSFTTPVPPLNDDCAGALPLTVGANFAANAVGGTILGAATTPGITPTCQALFNADVWYTVTVPISGNLILETQVAAANSMNDSVVAAFSGSCGTLMQIGCDDDGGLAGPNNFMSVLTLTGRTPGEVLYVGVWKYAVANPNSTNSQFLLSAYDCPSTVPAPTGNAAQSFCVSGTVADLVASGTAIKWYDAATLGNLLASTDALVSGNTYYASQTLACEGLQRLAVTVTINPQVTPTFDPIAPLCVDATAPVLPASSTNGITGTWSPATVDTATAGTVTYTFTADSGQCITATVVTLSITVNAKPAVTIQVPFLPICEGTTTTLTAVVSNNNSSVSFVDLNNVNQTLTIYPSLTFGVPLTSPLSGILFDTASNGCAAFAPGSLTGKIALIQRGTCTFVTKAQNAQDAGAIAVLIYNNQAGIINMGGVAPGITIPAYSMTQADGLALIASTVASELAITLSPPAPLTYLWYNGETTNPITTSILTADTPVSVTVTNTLTGCSTLLLDTIPVTPNTVPTFAAVAPICAGNTLSPLPTTSDNGYTGVWSPALDNTATTVYTFTPDQVAGECLTTATLTITVNNCPVLGCFNGSLSPVATYTPTTCDGVTVNTITSNGNAGEYSNVAVTSGQTYTFGSSVATDYITLSDDTGTTAFAAGTTPITWTFNATGVVRVYYHTNNACGTENVGRTKTVICGVACLNGVLYPADTYTPPICDGITENVVAFDSFAGEYSNITVTSGETYTFGSSVGTDHIVISNAAGNIALAGGTTPVTWVSTVAGVVRVYFFTNNTCGTEAVNRTRTIVCGIPASDLPNYVSLQWPPSLTFAQGGSGTVYGQVYEPGLTDVEPGYTGQGAGITAWVGVSPIGSNTNPNTWTDWTPATWNAAHISNNDEYQAAIGATLAPGTYYYATRFRLNAGVYVYGGIDASNNGDFWNGTTHNSGVLTVTPPPVPANDECAGAISLVVDDTFCNGTNTNGTNLGATNSGVAIAACFNYGENDVWFSFVAPTDTATVDISTDFLGGTLYDTEVALYSGACGSLLEIDCDNDSGITVQPNGFSWNSLMTDSAVTAGDTYYVRVSGYTVDDVGSFCLRVSRNTLSNEGFDTNNFTYYPNPVKNILNLSYTQNISSVVIFNLLGQEVVTRVVNANQSQIDMSDLPTGAYLVKVTADNQVKTIKVMKE